MKAVAWCLLVIVWVTLGASFSGEPADGAGVSFGLPFLTECAGREKIKGLIEYCHGLADSFNAGSKVVLMNRGGICTARTGARFTYMGPLDSEIKATWLIKADKCLKPDYSRPGQFERFQLALVGIDPETIHRLQVTDSSLPVPKLMESQARPLLNDSLPEGLELRVRRLVAVKSPKRESVTGDIKMLTFGYWNEYGWTWKDGPSLLFIHNRAFRLEGNCTHFHMFFAVKNRFFVTYIGSSCCDCGEWGVEVYDLSSGVPMHVYSNHALAD